MTHVQESRDLLIKGGTALIAGSLINILRVVPVFLSEGVSPDTFPPHDVDQIIFAAQLEAWTSSHAMALFGTVLLMFGVAVFARNAADRSGAAPGLMAQVGVTMSMGLLSLALISDGVVLPTLIDRLSDGGLAGITDNSGLIIYAHLIATTIGGLAATILLISGIFLGITLRSAYRANVLGWIGIAIGGLSLTGYLSGILSLNITATLHLTGPLTLLMFLYLSAIGVTLLRTAPQAP